MKLINVKNCIFILTISSCYSGVTTESKQDEAAQIETTLADLNSYLIILNSEHLAIHTPKFKSSLITPNPKSINSTAQIPKLVAPFPSIHIAKEPTASLALHWENLPSKKQPGFLIRFCAEVINCTTDFRLIDLTPAKDATPGLLTLYVGFSAALSTAATGTLQIIPIYASSGNETASQNKRNPRLSFSEQNDTINVTVGVPTNAQASIEAGKAVDLAENTKADSPGTLTETLNNASENNVSLPTGTENEISNDGKLISSDSAADPAAEPAGNNSGSGISVSQVELHGSAEGESRSFMNGILRSTSTKSIFKDALATGTGTGSGTIWSKDTCAFTTPADKKSTNYVTTGIEVVQPGDSCTYADKCITCTLVESSNSCTIDCVGTVYSSYIANDDFVVTLTYSSLLTSTMTVSTGAILVTGSITNWPEFAFNGQENPPFFDNDATTFSGCDGIDGETINIIPLTAVINPQSSSENLFHRSGAITALGTLNPHRCSFTPVFKARMPLTRLTGVPTLGPVSVISKICDTHDACSL